MFSEEVRGLLAQVITSWQVLAVTVVLIIYVFLVNYVARTHSRRRFSMPKIKKKKSSKTQVPAPEAASEDDELGLEETSKE